MKESFVVAEHLAKCHGRNSAARSFGCFDGPVRNFGRPCVAEGSARLPRSAALTVSEPVGVAGRSSADSEATIARERKNAKSLAIVIPSQLRREARHCLGPQGPCLDVWTVLIARMTRSASAETALVRHHRVMPGIQPGTK